MTAYTDAQHLIEENLMGWIIESNHLVDALLDRADTDEITSIMQRRYNAAYGTVLALRQQVDALLSIITEASRTELDLRQQLDEVAHA
jgi:hypothetical protein